MILKAKIKRAFGYGENPREKIMDFLLNEELADCKDDSTRWRRLFEKMATAIPLALDGGLR